MECHKDEQKNKYQSWTWFILVIIVYLVIIVLDGDIYTEVVFLVAGYLAS